MSIDKIQQVQITTFKGGESRRWPRRKYINTDDALVKVRNIDGSFIFIPKEPITITPHDDLEQTGTSQTEQQLILGFPSLFGEDDVLVMPLPWDPSFSTWTKYYQNWTVELTIKKGTVSQIQVRRVAQS